MVQTVTFLPNYIAGAERGERLRMLLRLHELQKEEHKKESPKLYEIWRDYPLHHKSRGPPP